MIETLFGGLLGGVFRIAPEILKWLDRKGDREHELAMLKAEMEFAKVKGEIVMRQTEATMTVAEMDAMAQAYKEQATTSSKSYRWVAAASALVRPAVTYAFVGLYFAVKIASFLLALDQNGEWAQVLVSMWNKEDMAMLTLILTFWFVGRVWDRSQSK